MKNRKTGSQHKWANPEKGCGIPAKDTQKTSDKSVRRKNTRNRIIIGIPTKNQKI